MTEARVRVLGDEASVDRLVVSQGDMNRKVHFGSFEQQVYVEHGIYPDSDVIVQSQDTEYAVKPGQVVQLILESKTIEVVHLADPINL